MMGNVADLPAHVRTSMHAVQSKEAAIRDLKLGIQQDEARLREAVAVREEAEASQSAAEEEVAMFRQHVLSVEAVSLQKMAAEAQAMQQRLADLQLEIEQYQRLRGRTHRPP